MKTLLTRALSLLLCALTLFPMTGFAAEARPAETSYGFRVEIDPNTGERYVTETDIPAPLVDPYQAESFDAASLYFREQLKNHEPEFAASVKIENVITDRDEMEKIVYGIIDVALEHNGNPTEGDYIAGQYCKMSIGIKQQGDFFGGVTLTIVISEINYFTTIEQEAEVDDAVVALLNELGVASMKTDYDKVKAVYEWMCDNISYDYDALKTDELLAHSAYKALVEHKAVCQGYALLLYRLCLEMGIDIRYITGTGNGGAHAWNIIKLGSYYYNADSTWDSLGWYPTYFLRGNAADNPFNVDGGSPDHIRDEAYLTPEFMAAYPMDMNDYDPSTACGHSETEVVDKKEATCTEAGYTGDTVCKICGEIIKKGEVIPALGHEEPYKTVNKKDATCTDDGYTGDQICPRCEKVMVEGAIIPALGHEEPYETVGKKDATCTDDGYTGDQVCPRCKDVVVKGEVIPKLGHDWDDDGRCKRCGIEKSDMPGDLDEDGELDISDGVTMQKVLAGIIGEDDPAYMRADIDQNGIIDVSDGVAMQKLLAGLAA